jgi:hypothetical protein
LQVVSSTSYTDSNGDFHVIGEIKNTGSNILTQVQLTIVVKDAAGNSLLRDFNNTMVPFQVFTPMLTDLAPGETSPYGYTIFAGSGTPDPNSVTVTPSSLSERAHREQFLSTRGSKKANNRQISGLNCRFHGPNLLNFKQWAR